MDKDMNKRYAVVGQRIKYLREKYDLNKTEFAKRIGVDRTTITRYESGEIAPILEIMLKIKKEFGVSLDWLAGDDTEEKDYSKVINECKKTGISPEKLKQIIDIIKN